MHRHIDRLSWALTLATHLLMFAFVRAQSLECPPPSQCVFRVLAIGDSLTAGAVPSKGTTHPYTLKLQQLLDSKFSERATVSVTTAGYNYMGVFQKAKDANGQTLNITLLPLLKATLQQANDEGTSYQWVVIMAGINDLGAGNYTAAAIMPKLQEAYKMALDSGANVLAIAPWPNRFVTRDSKNEQERIKLVAQIRQYVATKQQKAGSNCGGPKVYLQQLPGGLFNFWAMPAGRVSQMQDDLLHLTEHGYDVLGGLIFDTISRNVPLRECMCPVKAQQQQSSGRNISGNASGTRAATTSAAFTRP